MFKITELVPGFVYDANIDFNKISKSEIDNFLPHWRTKINEVYQYRRNNMIEINILVAATSETEIQQWIRDYEEKSKCSYSIRSTEKCSGTKVKFKQRLKCQHNTRNKNVNDPTQHRKTKNSNCPSTITVTLRTVKNKYQGKDKSKAPDPSMPCEIKILPYHNHSTSSTDSLRFRRVNNKTRDKLVDLFESGYSPLNALESLKMDIQMKHDNFYELLDDRGVCPDYMYCYHLYLKVFKKKHWPLEATPDFLKNKVDEFNTNMSRKSAVIKFIDKDYVICLCPPLMQRVHETIEEASHSVFLESNHGGQRIFVLLTPSHCGGLPLAIFITTSGCAQLISVGFQLLKEIMGDRIFYGNIDGPTLFMTDDSAAELAAVQSEWPESANLLSIFHVLQSVWRWLMKMEHGIKEEHQNDLFQEFRSIMYANNEEECKTAFQIAITRSEEYPKYQSFLNNYWNQRSLWALCYRNNSRQGYDTNNLSEAAMHLLEEKIFDRIKAFNLVEVLDFMMTKLVSYYERRLLDAAHKRTGPNILQRLNSVRPSLDTIEHIQDLTDSIHLVPSEKESNLSYIVNTEVLSCTCNQGKRASMCKHIDWICCFIKSDTFIEKNYDERTRRTYFFIATGNQPPRNWLEPSFEGVFLSEKIKSESPINYVEKIEIIWEPSIDKVEEAGEDQYIPNGSETINEDATNYTENIEMSCGPSIDNLEEADEKEGISKGMEIENGNESATNDTENIEMICDPFIDNLEEVDEKEFILKRSEIIDNLEEADEKESILKRSEIIDNLEEADEKESILKGSEIINGNKPTANYIENIEIIWEPSVEEADEEQCILKGSETISGMSEIFSEYLKRSPLEMSKALQVFSNGLKNIKSVSGFATACHTFSSGTINRRKKKRCKIPVQPTAVSRRRRNFSERRISAGGTVTSTVERRKPVIPKKD